MGCREKWGWGWGWDGARIWEGWGGMGIGWGRVEWGHGWDRVRWGWGYRWGEGGDAAGMGREILMGWGWGWGYSRGQQLTQGRKAPQGLALCL